ncbi:hypothetical protein [Myroides odoratimimus]|uniref:Uncharacterized protein n=1 Tax=Myroides odoratimimus CIP 101113 TaxID=883154 RepID=A0AAV3F587_9FLAO|nr:hypothetical protein [Myroides odoratimimus]EHO13815.1 hypothetical protein HMPREF9715_00889 [Myroides odoratimimus CIP 101113]
MKDDTIYLYDAIKMMRKLTQMGVPFSFEYKTYSTQKKSTNGFRSVERALLRPGLREDQSDLSDSLIAFTEYPSGEPKFFHLPLLTNFNGRKIRYKNDRT